MAINRCYHCAQPKYIVVIIANINIEITGRRNSHVPFEFLLVGLIIKST